MTMLSFLKRGRVSSFLLGRRGPPFLKIKNNSNNQCYHSKSFLHVDPNKHRTAAASRTTPHASSSSSSEETPPTTVYTIDCPPTHPDELTKIVTKHCLTLEQFLQHQPIAAHTVQAFNTAMTKIMTSNNNNNNNSNNNAMQILLDSGCGTGRSTRHLAGRNKRKDHHQDTASNTTWVLGIDRSLVRLTRNHKFRQQQEEEEDVVVWTDDDDDDDDDSSSNNNTDANNNILYIRAELVSFWRLLLQYRRESPQQQQQQQPWNLQTHYLLYPNPYPKPKRLKSRWYGHPSFPLILQLGGDIVIRSNWELYLQEFAQAVIIADQVWSSADNKNNDDDDDGNNLPTCINYARPYLESAKQGPVRRIPEGVNTGWSNFERKMDAVGEATFELHLKRMLDP